VALGWGGKGRCGGAEVDSLVVRWGRGRIEWGWVGVGDWVGDGDKSLVALSLSVVVNCF